MYKRQAQTYENWQLVVGGDGSTDGTISILEEFSKQYPEQVTIIKNDPPQGSAKDNFISLIQNSYGPYFMFCDQDDVWKPDKIYLTLQKICLLYTSYFPLFDDHMQNGIYLSYKIKI